MKRITMSDLEKKIDAHNNGENVEHGCFYAYDYVTGNWTAADNRTGEMWLEVFPTKEAAKEWLA